MMSTVSIQLKRLGKKKVRTLSYDLPEVKSLGELIEALVRQEVGRYNEAREGASLMPFLSPGDIQEQSHSGKIGFGDLNNREPAAVDESIEVAKQGFLDGLFVVFHNDEELKELDAPLSLTEDSVLAIIRLTFLTGRHW